MSFRDQSYTPVKPGEQSYNGSLISSGQKLSANDDINTFTLSPIVEEVQAVYEETKVFNKEEDLYNSSCNSLHNVQGPPVNRMITFRDKVR